MYSLVTFTMCCEEMARGDASLSVGANCLPWVYSLQTTAQKIPNFRKEERRMSWENMIGSVMWLLLVQEWGA